MGKSDFIMMPYWDTEKEDFRFGPSLVAQFYRNIVEDGNAGTVFYNGVIKNETDWARHCGSKGVCLFGVFKKDGGAAIGVIWLSHFSDKTAHINYVSFKSEVPKYSDVIRIGKELVQELLHKQDGSGYILDSLIGLAPVFNRKSTLFGLHCGGKIAGTLPLGVWVADRGRSEPCHIISFERAEHENL